MKLLVDINLSPDWLDFLRRHDFGGAHWSEVGDPRASDAEILAWARNHGHVVFSHDLDFSRILSLSRAAGPSVFQVRTQDILPSTIGSLVVRTLQQHGAALEAGAIVVLDASSSRARILPI